MSDLFTYEILRDAIDQRAAALRSVTRLQPIGGPGDKVFPPTFGDTMTVPGDDARSTQYAVEKRKLNGETVLTVLLDSVAAQANRMEEALLDAWNRGELDFPVVSVDFRDFDGRDGEIALDDLGGDGRISALEAPHRLADALLRDSVDEEGTLFRATEPGREFNHASPQDATPIFKLCPTALVFGMWDSTGPRGGLGAKFERAIVSEITGVDVELGIKTRSRIDPTGIEKKAGTIYARAGEDEEAAEWTLDPEEARTENGDPVRFGRTGEDHGTPAAINHGNVVPATEPEAGGVTMDHAIQRTVLSIPALRRLRFPRTVDNRQLDDSEREAAENAVRTTLAALGVAAMAYHRAEGYDLRSRCALQPEAAPSIEVLGRNGGVSGPYAIDTDGAARLLEAATREAASHGFSWERQPLELRPSQQLVELIRRSRALNVTSETEE